MSSLRTARKSEEVGVLYNVGVISCSSRVNGSTTQVTSHMVSFEIAATEQDSDHGDLTSITCLMDRGYDAGD